MSGLNVPNTTGTQAIQTWSEYYGIPSWIPLSISNVETGGTYSPTAAGDKVNGKPTSFGLFQLHTPGGQGTGYTPQQLYNPILNSEVGIGAMQAAYTDGVKQKLSGYPLLAYVAAHSGHPSYAGTLPSSYATKLQAAYKQVTGQTPSTTGTSTSTSAPASAPSSSSSGGLFGGLTSTLSKGIWILGGIVLIALGLYLVFNPMNDIGGALKNLTKRMGKQEG